MNPIGGACEKPWMSLDYLSTELLALVFEQVCRPANFGLSLLLVPDSLVVEEDLKLMR
jgi:hypothetical protein